MPSSGKDLLALGRMVRAERESRQWSVLRVSKATGFNNQSLTELEAGKLLKPSVECLIELGLLFNKDVGHILVLAGYPRAAHYFKTSSSVHMFADKRITPLEERALLAVLEAMRAR